MKKNKVRINSKKESINAINMRLIGIMFNSDKALVGVKKQDGS